MMQFCQSKSGERKLVEVKAHRTSRRTPRGSRSRSGVLWNCLILVLVLNWCLPESSFGKPTVEELENACLEERAKIRTGSLRLNAKGTAANRDGAVYVHIEYAVWFDDASIRCDVRQLIPRLADGPFTETVVFSTEGWLRYSDKVDSGGVGQVLAVGTLGSPNVESRKRTLFDPRKMGLVVCTPTVYHGVDVSSYFGRGDLLESRVDAADHEGQPVFVITARTSAGVTLRKWIDPNRGYSMVRGETRSVYLDQELVDTVECEITWHPEAAVWFPESVRSRRHLGGKLDTEEVLTVVHASLNEPVNPRVFQPGDLAIPAGREVLNDDQGSVDSFWDGKEIVRYDATTQRYLHFLRNELR